MFYSIAKPRPNVSFVDSRNINQESKAEPSGNRRAADSGYDGKDTLFVGKGDRAKEYHKSTMGCGPFWPD